MRKTAVVVCATGQPIGEVEALPSASPNFVLTPSIEGSSQYALTHERSGACLAWSEDPERLDWLALRADELFPSVWLEPWPPDSPGYLAAGQWITDFLRPINRNLDLLVEVPPVGGEE